MIPVAGNLLVFRLYEKKILYFLILFLINILSLSALALTESNLYEIPLKNGASLAIAEQPSDPAALEAFNQLSEAEKIRFLERRKDIISSVIKYMTFPKTLGGIKWFKNQIIKVREVTNRAGSLINWVGRHFQREKFQQPTENFLTPTAERKATPVSITELGLQALTEIVQIMDQELWKDAPLIARAKKSGWTFYLGGSAGAAIGKVGFYKLKALELDIDYDFEKQEKEINLYYGKQSLKNSVFVFELHMVFGALKRYSISVVSESITTEVTALPLVMGYRRSAEQVAVGMVSGISLINSAAAIMIATGYPEAGAAIIAAVKPLHSFSLFWTDLERKKLYSKTLQQYQTESFRKLRCSALF